MVPIAKYSLLVFFFYKFKGMTVAPEVQMTYDVCLTGLTLGSERLDLESERLDMRSKKPNLGVGIA